MKHIDILLTGVFLSCTAKCQDKIIEHSGDTINCKVSEVLEKEIKYTFKDETVINIISKNLVNKIIFSSGRMQPITDKIIVTNEKDWQKVIITNLESDVTGLKKIGEIHAKASSGWSTTGEGKMQAKALERLKKEAASSGAFIVLLLTQSTHAGTYGLSGGTKASFIGIAYTYN